MHMHMPSSGRCGPALGPMCAAYLQPRHVRDARGAEEGDGAVALHVSPRGVEPHRPGEGGETAGGAEHLRRPTHALRVQLPW